MLRPPSYGAALVSIDSAEISSIPGIVRFIRNGRFIAVVARREEQAIRALERLRAHTRWHENETMPGREAIFPYMRR